jgi:hypothetical protein
MQSETNATGRTIGKAISVALAGYRECYKLFDELADRVEESKAGLRSFPWWTFEAVAADDPNSCIRARLARFFVPNGSLGRPKREITASESEGAAHLRLDLAGRIAFATAEFFRHDGSLPMPMVWYGVVDQFVGAFLKGEAVLIQRGDLAAILDSTDFRIAGARQPVFGRTRNHKAGVRVRVWSQMAAIRTLDDVGLLAKAVLETHASPETLEKVEI